MSETANAKVSVTIDVRIISGGSWGKDCTVGQVHKQALDMVRGRLSQLCRDNPDISLHNDMKVHMITYDIEAK